MAKRYRLLKDLPDGAKVGDTYQQFNISNKYYNVRLYEEATAYLEGYNWETWQVENNPTWFEEIKEKERIRVSSFSRYEDLTDGDVRYGFCLNAITYKISSEKEALIKEGIEKVLNDDSVFDADRINKQLEKLKAMEDAFNESRLTNPMIGFKHDSFQDYLKSLNNK